MSKRALLVKLKRHAEQSTMNDTVRQISQLMDELSAGVVDGEPVPEITLEQLMESAHGPENPQG